VVGTVNKLILLVVDRILKIDQVLNLLLVHELWLLGFENNFSVLLVDRLLLFVHGTGLGPTENCLFALSRFFRKPWSHHSFLSR
jgi:hypothetical protein